MDPGLPPTELHPLLPTLNDIKTKKCPSSMPKGKAKTVMGRKILWRKKKDCFSKFESPLLAHDSLSSVFWSFFLFCFRGMCHSLKIIHVKSVRSTSPAPSSVAIPVIKICTVLQKIWFHNIKEIHSCQQSWGLLSKLNRVAFPRRS